MAIGALNHRFVNPHADGADATKTQPSNWNDAIMGGGGAQGNLLMYDPAGDATYKLNWSAGLTWVSPLLSVTGGITLVGASRNVLWNTDGGGNIGAPGATRPDNGYFKTSLVTPVLDRGADLSLAFQVNSGTRWSIDNSAGGVSGTAYALSPVDNTGAIGTATRRVANANIASYVAIGTDPSGTGELRLPNNGAGIKFRNAANNADYLGMSLDSGNALNVGTNTLADMLLQTTGSTGFRFRYGNSTTSEFDFDGSQIYPQTDNVIALGTAGKRWTSAFLSTALAIGTNPATTGAARFANNTFVVWRNAANGANLSALGVDTSNNFIVGGDFTSVQLGGGTPVIKIGGLTSAFPALRRNGTNLDVRLADDSAYATLHAGTVYAEANIFMGVGQLAGIQAPGAAVLTLLNNAGTDFARLQFGGTSSLFPAWKRNGASFQAVLADGSGQTGISADNFQADTLIAIGATIATAGAIRLANGLTIQARNSGNTGNLQMIALNSSNQVVLAESGADIKWGQPNVALGGGAAPTLGTIGGSGPASAAQNAWMRVVDSTGAAFWVPTWK